MSRIGDAQQGIQSLLRRDPLSTRLATYVGHFYFISGRPDDALAVLEQSWPLIAPLQLRALASEPAAAPHRDADTETDTDAAGIVPSPDEGGQDGPTELL